MTARSWLATLLDHLRTAYMRSYKETLRLGEAPIEKGDELCVALQNAVSFTDLVTASDLRRRAGLGKVDTSAGFLLREIEARNPWFRKHRIWTAPVTEERVRVLLDAEKFYLENVKNLRAKASTNHALSRADMLLRHASSAVSQVSEQVQLAIPEVGDAFPLGQYLTRDDSRVRPSHKAMYGFLAARSHQIWAVIRPPNGFNCRCYVRWVTWAEIKREKWERWCGEQVYWPNTASKRSFERREFPDEGWRGPKIVAGSLPSRSLAA